MRKLLSALLCMLLLCSTCLAEGTVPVAPPSQEELMEAFLANVLGFFGGVDVKEDALRLDVSALGSDVLAAAVQQSEGLMDIDVTANGTPVHIQLTGDAIYGLIDGALYKLPYENIPGIMSQLSSVQANGTSGSRPVNVQQLQSVLMFAANELNSAVTTEPTENGQHILVDIDEARLVALGDALAAYAPFIEVYTAVTGRSDLAITWPMLRAMLEGGQLPASLRIEITTEGVTGAIDVKARLAEAQFDMSGHADDTSADFNLTCGDGSTGVDFHFDAAMADGALGGSFTLKPIGDEAQAVNGEARIDLATGRLTGRLDLPEGFTVDLEGEGTADGLRATVTASQNGATLGTLDCTLSVSEELATIKAVLTAGGETVMESSLDIATQTGAFSLHADFADGTCLEGLGEASDEGFRCTLTGEKDGTLYVKYVMMCADDSEAYSYFVRGDVFDGKKMNRTVEMYFDIDKRSGSFTGTWWTPQSRSRIEVQGQVTDDLFRFRGNANMYGSLDLTVMRDAEDRIMGDVKASGLAGSLTGNFLWSPSAKTLVANLPTLRMNASLIQNDDGMPMDLRLSWQDIKGKRYVEAKVSKAGIYYSENGHITTVTGEFADEHTYVVEYIRDFGKRMDEYRATMRLTAQDDALKLEITDGSGEVLYEVALSKAEQTEVGLLADDGDAIEITPELVARMASGSAD